ncbi:hypothetical protein LOK49_LG05G01730 [Camellia lanceoleosa]|uniref:Uncharacterized protein n=1 Tax=Camellia lanceoleosa TaxID=1840588 RepID=A0ACC0HRC9_9ERIC|nr:hypothetical protein LOK49_LG05G01730 [Camellia lanceoleosa]
MNLVVGSSCVCGMVTAALLFGGVNLVHWGSDLGWWKKLCLVLKLEYALGAVLNLKLQLPSGFRFAAELHLGFCSKSGMEAESAGLGCWFAKVEYAGLCVCICCSDGGGLVVCWVMLRFTMVLYWAVFLLWLYMLCGVECGVGCVSRLQQNCGASSSVWSAM